MKRKKASTAKLIRRTTKAILRDCNERIKFQELVVQLKEKLSAIRIRADFVMSSLTVTDSGFDVYDDGTATIVTRRGKVPEREKGVICDSESEKVKVTKEKRLTVERFVNLAIEKIGQNGSLHTVFSGFNEAFRIYFPGRDPVKEVNKLASQGKVFCRPAKGGAVISFIPPLGQQALKKMGLL